jgi:hypothetical protein
MHAPGAHAGAVGAVRAVLQQVIAGAAGDGSVRSDVPAHELARFCEHAVGAAGGAGAAGTRHVVMPVLAALQPPP